MQEKLSPLRSISDKPSLPRRICSGHTTYSQRRRRFPYRWRRDHARPPQTRPAEAQGKKGLSRLHLLKAAQRAFELRNHRHQFLTRTCGRVTGKVAALEKLLKLVQSRARKAARTQFLIHHRLGDRRG